MVTVNPDSGAAATTGGRLAEHGIAYDVERSSYDPVLIGRSSVCWGAVIAGALVAISLSILSGALAYACGVPAYAGGTYGWGAGIWTVVTAFVVFLIGGGCVGYFTPYASQRTGALHGFMAWVLAVCLLLVVTGAAFGMFHMGINGMAHSTLNPVAVNQPTWATEKGAAWGTFIALGVGLIASAIGGMMGFTSKSTIVRTH